MVVKRDSPDFRTYSTLFISVFLVVIVVLLHVTTHNLLLLIAIAISVLATSKVSYEQ
jgi:hypothetical protein